MKEDGDLVDDAIMSANRIIYYPVNSLAIYYPANGLATGES